MLRNAYLMNGRGRFVAGEDELVLKLRSAIKQAWDYSVFRTKNLPRVLKRNLLIYLCRDVLQGPAVLNHSCLFQMRGNISSHLIVIFIFEDDGSMENEKPFNIKELFLPMQKLF